MSQEKATAILLFSRTASEEAGAKTFNHGLNLRGNKAISQCLIQQTESIARHTHLPFYRCYSTEQEGNYFGERLANAIESVYAKGHDQVIVIGNDCPFITSSMLLSVSQQLNNKRLVLGPANDGGVYLIGIQKRAYNRGKFLSLPWQETILQNGWRTYAQQVSISINWLESHFDIDHAIDFKNLLKLLPFHHRLRKKLIRICTPDSSTVFFVPIESYSKEQLPHLPLRGPPFFL